MFTIVSLRKKQKYPVYFLSEAEQRTDVHIPNGISVEFATYLKNMNAFSKQIIIKEFLINYIEQKLKLYTQRDIVLLINLLILKDGKSQKLGLKIFIVSLQHATTAILTVKKFKKSSVLPQFPNFLFFQCRPIRC